MNKRLIVIGDSITKGTYTQDGDSSPNSVVEINFSTLIKCALGYTELINHGINGTAISSTSKIRSELAICIRAKEMQDADTVIVAGGTNDYGNNVVLGDINDKEDISFYGALDVLCRTLKQKYKRVYFITPIRREQDGKNGAGYSLEEYRRAIELKAKEYNFVVIDGYGVPIYPKTEEHRKKYMYDGLHPNAEGHKLYADYIIERIKDYENGNI